MKYTYRTSSELRVLIHPIDLVATHRPSLRLHNFPVSSDEASPLIPDLFHAQKVYIFKALEQDAFPRFLRAKAFGNLTPLGSFVRLVAGLLILWGGFVLAFTLVFLDFKPKITRLWASPVIFELFKHD